MTDLEPIDVIMCTWNSNKPYFRKCLRSVRREVDLHHFIVIDRYSSDQTLEVVRSVFPDAKIFQTAVNLACARGIGIANVDTRYFAFIDDDIEVSDGWFTELISFIKGGKQVGAVQGFVRLYVDYLNKAIMFELSRRKGHVKEVTARGYTNNTLLVTEIVRDLNFLPSVHSWEDFLITQHVMKKGYKWFETDQAQVTNYGDADWSYFAELRRYLLRGKWHGAGDRLVHIHSSSFVRGIAHLLLSSFKGILYAMIIAIAVSDPRILPTRFFGQLGYLVGFLYADKNIVPYKLHTAARHDAFL
jgi:glycosyltransferase involved in cell wall biosynthesis